MKPRYYVGIRPDRTRQLFRASETPTETSHGHLYVAATGPFRTKRGAAVDTLYGFGNPHICHVDDAERLAHLPAFRFDPLVEALVANRVTEPGQA